MQTTPSNAECCICRDVLDGPSHYSCQKLECQAAIRELKSQVGCEVIETGRRKRPRNQRGRPFVRDPVTGLKLRVEL